MEDSHTDP